MRNHVRYHRRDLLKTFLTLGAMNFPVPVRAKSVDSLAGLHEVVANHVRDLIGDRQVELVMLHPEGCQANLIPLVQQFRKDTGVTIQLSSVGVDDINTTMIFKTSQEEYVYDIALPATFGMPDLVTVDALQPLGMLAKKYEPEGYKENQLYDYGDYFNDEFYGYQTDGDTYLMFYHREMLEDNANRHAYEDQFGKALAVPKTWDELDRQIRFFHKPDQQQYGGCLFRIAGYGAWEWWSRFHAKGYYPLDDFGTPQIDTDAGIEALEEMISVSAYLHPNSQSDGLFENWATFAKGQSFCNIGWGGSQKYFNSLKSSIKGKLVYSPMPGGVLNGEVISCPIFNWGWNYVVSRQSPEPELAYLFTLYACSPVMSTLSVQQDGFFDPYRLEHYEDTTIQSVYTPEFLDAHKRSMQQSIPDFYLQNQSEYLSLLQENIHLALNGQLTAKQALEVTSTEWEQVTNQVGREGQVALWRALKNKYPQSLRDVLIG